MRSNKRWRRERLVYVAAWLLCGVIGCGGKGSQKEEARKPDGDKPAKARSLTAQEQKTGIEHGQFVKAVAFSPDGKSLATAGFERIHFWNSISGEKLGPNPRFQGEV